MKTKEKRTGKADVGRRSFLKTVGMASGVAAAAAATVVKPSEAADLSESKGAGYQETDHVRTYYDRARF